MPLRRECGTSFVWGARTQQTAAVKFTVDLTKEPENQPENAQTMAVDQGGAKRSHESTDTSSQKKARAIQFALPTGARWFLIGEKESHIPCRKQRSEIRAALTSWMRKQQANLIPKWDQRMPDDVPTTVPFDRYLDNLEEVGAWGCFFGSVCFGQGPAIQYSCPRL